MEGVKTQRLLDRLAIAVSGLCVLHCLITPVLLILIPVLASTNVADKVFHRILLAFVLPFSLAALLLGCRRHKDWIVFVLGILGLALLILTAWFGHDSFGETGERIATVLGGLTLAIGHVRNYRLCRRDGCDA
ncbi:MAG: hypothetical protein V7641_1721 [Blastocatellia bacterium]